MILKTKTLLLASTCNLKNTFSEIFARLYIPEVQAAPEAQSWPLEAVVQVATRRWCLQERAVELFLSSGHAHMLAFADQHERAAFLKALAASPHPPAR